jgi:hypothetical protein
VFCNADVAVGHLSGVQLWICEIGPHGGYAHCVGPDTHFEAAVHVSGHVESCPRCRGTRGCSSSCQGQLGESVAYALQLHQRRKDDVDVRFTGLRLVEARDGVGSQYSYRHLLRDDGLSVSAKVVIEHGVIVTAPAGGKRRVRAVGRGRGDGEGQQGYVVFLCKADLGRGRVQGRFEGAIERTERHFEVDDIVGGGLDGIRVENGILRSVRLGDGKARAGLQWRARCGRSTAAFTRVARHRNSRPHLRALLRNDGEAHLVVAELEPRERTQRVEGGRELCRSQSRDASRRGVAWAFAYS